MATTMHVLSPSILALDGSTVPPVDWNSAKSVPKTLPKESDSPMSEASPETPTCAAAHFVSKVRLLPDLDARRRARRQGTAHGPSCIS